MMKAPAALLPLIPNPSPGGTKGDKPPPLGRGQG
jgi:hypothetical protein